MSTIGGVLRGFGHRLAEDSAPAKADSTKASLAESPSSNWVSVLAPEELPKGVRKEVSIDGTAVLLFWYRNQIYAIAARSPAEGAYSEGFIKAKFTQDYGIICTQTGSVFSLKDGSVLEWYPSNPVLRSITPVSAPLPVRTLCYVLYLTTAVFRRIGKYSNICIRFLG
jgi:nitrite reductase/ring-hydroxylating ferredoxin subunit